MKERSFLGDCSYFFISYVLKILQSEYSEMSYEFGNETWSIPNELGAL